jgi:hypothetical protein
MISLPIASYFLTVDRVFNGMLAPRLPPNLEARLSFMPHSSSDLGPNVCLIHITGNSTYAGSLAAIVANAVLISYIFLAMAEDKEEQQQAASSGGEGKKEGKKDQ